MNRIWSVFLFLIHFFRVIHIFAHPITHGHTIHCLCSTIPQCVPSQELPDRLIRVLSRVMYVPPILTSLIRALNIICETNIIVAAA